MKLLQRFNARALVLFILVVVAAMPLAGIGADDTSATGQQAILVTGASSGIGLNMTETLAAEGYFIYAGARKQADLDALNAIENVQAIRLDVTKQDEIDAGMCLRTHF